MKKNSIIALIFQRYRALIKDIDFKTLSDDKFDYRELLLTTANDIIFKEGRNTIACEWLIEWFRNQDITDASRDLRSISQLTDLERKEFNFYMDLKDMCLPIVNREPIDFTAFPWCLAEGRLSLIENKSLVALLLNWSYRRLAATILDNLTHYYMFQWEMRNAVVQDTLSTLYDYKIRHNDWNDTTKLNSAIEEVVDELIEIENHMELGRRMGMNHTAQAVYDMLDTFIAQKYDYQQVDCALEVGAWIDAHWDSLSMEYPADKDVEALWKKLNDTMHKYDISFIKDGLTWDYICSELLGMSMFSQEQREQWAKEDELDDFLED